VVENVPNKKAARTMGCPTLKTHQVLSPQRELNASPGERRGKMKARHLRHTGSRQVFWSGAVLVYPEREGLPLFTAVDRTQAVHYRSCAARACTLTAIYPERSEGPAFSSRRGRAMSKNKNRPGEIITGTVFLRSREDWLGRP